ncbi:hypothetical protein CDAR_213311 [Caerostris darwini]|uniref:Uncharacterized protein n=1 Tax=Caerostris darwini TaxID=1538125 RepID=A0AAV4PW38_9ARAC|nr:hypothetical protein CDAR_213311 [Caerostris darwini]
MRAYKKYLRSLGCCRVTQQKLFPLPRWPFERDEEPRNLEGVPPQTTQEIRNPFADTLAALSRGDHLFPELAPAVERPRWYGSSNGDGPFMPWKGFRQRV